MDWNQFDFQNAANGLVIILGFILTALGVKNGIAKRGQGTGEHVEIAGAIIDKTQVVELVGVVNRLTHTLERQSRLYADIHEDIKDARTEIRDLIKEIIRAGR